MKRSVLFGSILAAGLTVYLAGAATDGEQGRVKIVRVGNLTPIECEIIEERTNDYLIKMGAAKLRIPKTQVSRIIPLGEWKSENAPVVDAIAVSDDDIERIIGSENIEIDALAGLEQVDLSGEFPADLDSIDEMKRIAGRKAKILYTKHFVFVYTSERAQAADLASRLERIFEWHLTYMKQLHIPMKMPESKLEIYYFGTNDEYLAYQTLQGFRDSGALGFYMRTTNRSSFFDMNTYPQVARRLKQANNKNIPYMQRQKARNEAEIWADITNLKVVQHEASHHIQFNIGVFPKGGDLPRWMTEGLATMYEVPSTSAGAALGAINHSRLGEFHKFYLTADDKPTVPWEYVRDLALSDRMRNSYEAYVMGWGLNQYLLRKKKEGYSKWMQALASRDDNWEQIDQAKKSAQFEDIFGKVDEAWVKDFFDYIAGLTYRSSLDFQMSLP